MGLTSFPNGITTSTLAADTIEAGGTAVTAGGTVSIADLSVSGTATAARVISTAAVKSAGTVQAQGNASIVAGAGTVSTGLTAVTGFVATINAALGGTTNETANSVGGSVLGGTALVLGITDHAGAAAAGTVSVGWIAWGTA